MALDELSVGTYPERTPGSRGPLRILTLPFRFLFRLFKRSIAGILRLIAYHPASSGIVVVLLAAVGFLGYQDYAATPHGAAGQVSSSVPRSAAAENFIKGQATFDANLMWQGLSDGLKQSLTQRGTNLQALQQQLDQRKQAGTKVEQADFGGGVLEPDGSRVFLYVLRMDVPGNQGPVAQTYVLTVDPTDKITKVE